MISKKTLGGGNFPWSNPMAQKPQANKWNPTLKIGGWQNPNAASGGAWNRPGPGSGFGSGEAGWKPENREKPPVTERNLCEKKKYLKIILSKKKGGIDLYNTKLANYGYKSSTSKKTWCYKL